jgi:hypothetical protein
MASSASLLVWDEDVASSVDVRIGPTGSGAIMLCARYSEDDQVWMIINWWDAICSGVSPWTKMAG